MAAALALGALLSTCSTSSIAASSPVPTRPASPIRAPARTGTARSQPTWPRHVIDRGNYGYLTGTTLGLYAVRFGTGHRHDDGQVVRVDETTGRVTAASPVIADPGPPVATATAVWVVGSRHPVPGPGPGPWHLYRLDPTTLHSESNPVVSSKTLFSPDAITADGDHLWIETAGCTLERLDGTGRPVAGVTLPGRTCTSSLALAPGALYTTVQPSETRLALQRRDPEIGRLRATVDVPDTAPSGVAVAGTRRDLWAASGFPGASGDLYWYSTRTLTLLGASGTGGGDGPTIGHAPIKLPSFGEFPSIDLSDHTVWADGSGVIACIDPSTGKVRAVTTEFSGPILSAPIVVTAHGTYAVAFDTGNKTPTGIARLHPPPACLPG